VTTITVNPDLNPGQVRDLDHIIEEARLTKPSHYTTYEATMLLIAERHERMILNRDDVLAMVAYITIRPEVLA